MIINSKRLFEEFNSCIYLNRLREHYINFYSVEQTLVQPYKKKELLLLITRTAFIRWAM